MKLSENFAQLPFEEQKREMRIKIVQALKDGENIEMDMFLYENHTEKGIPIEAWLQANDEEE
ncbi:hypothetical protein H8B06_18700 [Sphingobacterium sp. DN00404]|uniref:Uncharacterized protein n=1 Tax=Sphingobacterium micropteri TaxID=2763501 RepID=A0ABR7YU57_9SPHI|nr:hypothetical protein [Sphingobacterium micropteri]MBD1434860.1 hypothetical protein [Sphingobacterium micropteri]